MATWISIKNLVVEFSGLIPGGTKNLTKNFRFKPVFGSSPNRTSSKSSLAGFELDSVLNRSNFWFRPKISGSNWFLDRVQTRPAWTHLWQDLSWSRFHFGPDLGLDREFPVKFPVGPETHAFIYVVDGDCSTLSSFFLLLYQPCSPPWPPLLLSIPSHCDFTP
jgi:hypothetical protein